jgi:hypothetical protein
MRLHSEPDTNWKNIFQLWEQNGRRLPFVVAKNTWSAEAGHYAFSKVQVAGLASSPMEILCMSYSRAIALHFPMISVFASFGYGYLPTQRKVVRNISLAL